MSTRSLNKVMIIGNLTRDPIQRFTAKNNMVVNFGVATNRDWVNDAGEKQEDVEYHNVVAWTKLAEICAQLLHKGDKVFIEGRLQTRDWQGEDGQTRRQTEIIAETMILLRSNNARAMEAIASEDTKVATNDTTPSEAEDVSDDIPF